MKQTTQRQNEQPAAPRLTANHRRGLHFLEVVTIDIENVKSWLLRYSEAHRSCELLKERLDLVEVAAYNTKSATPDGMPHGGADPVDTIGRTVARLDSLRAKLAAAQAEAATVYAEIETAIERISGKKSTEKQALLQLRYLDLLRISEINGVLFGGERDFIEREDSYLRRTTYLQTDALKDLSIILDAQRVAETATQADEKI